MENDIAVLESDIGNIMLSRRKILDWTEEAPKQSLQPPAPLTPPPPAVRTINLSPPYYVHISNLPYVSSAVEIYYFFGGFDKLKSVFLYKDHKDHDKPRGDCMLHVKNIEALVHILKMDRESLRDRPLRVHYVDPLLGQIRDIPANQLDHIREPASAKFDPHNFGSRDSKQFNKPHPRTNPDKKFKGKSKSQESDRHVLLRRNQEPLIFNASLESTAQLHRKYGQPQLRPLTEKRDRCRMTNLKSLSNSRSHYNKTPPVLNNNNKNEEVFREAKPTTENKEKLATLFNKLYEADDPKKSASKLKPKKKSVAV